MKREREKQEISIIVCFKMLHFITIAVLKQFYKEMCWVKANKCFYINFINLFSAYLKLKYQ